MIFFRNAEKNCHTGNASHMAVYINIGQADKSIRIHYAALRRITVKGFCSTVNDSQVRSALAECGTFSVSGVQNTFTDTKACRCYLKKLICINKVDSLLKA